MGEIHYPIRRRLHDQNKVDEYRPSPEFQNLQIPKMGHPNGHSHYNSYMYTIFIQRDCRPLDDSNYVFLSGNCHKIYQCNYVIITIYSENALEIS